MFKQLFFLILIIFTRAHNHYARNIFPIVTVQPDENYNHHHGDEDHDHRDGEKNHTHPEDIHEHAHTHVIAGKGPATHNHVHDHSLGEHSDHSHENDWVKCADEYEICACEGIVRFGYNRTFASYRVQLPRNIGSSLGNESNTTIEIACNMRSFAMDRNCINKDEADFPYESEKICECKGILNPNKILNALAEKKWFPTWAAVLAVIFGILLFCGVTSRAGLRRKHGLEFNGPIDAERRASLVINEQLLQFQTGQQNSSVAINKSAADSFGI